MATPIHTLVFLNSSRRLLSTKAAVDASKAAVIGYQRSKLPNGVTVGSIDVPAPVTRIAISAKAGSRYETSENRGAAHVLRVMTGSRTDDTTAVTITRHLQQLGAKLSCTVDRDVVSYELLCLKDLVPEAIQYLKEAALHPLFRSWELSDNKWRLSHDLAALAKNPSVQLVEALYEAAYRSGLSNSIFCPEHMVGHHTTEMMTNYVKQHFTSGRLAISGIGISHGELTDIANGLSAESGAGSSASSVYRGGEVRKDTGGDQAHAAVAVNFPNTLSLKEVVGLHVLSRVLGTGSHTKYGAGLGSRFGAALAKAAPDTQSSASAFVLFNEESSLIGFSSSSPAGVAGQVTKALADEMKMVIGGKLSDADVAAAKAKCKAEFFGMSSDAILSDMATDCLTLPDEYMAIPESFQILDNITAQDITTVARKILGGKPCMAAVGNTSNVPYMDQL